MAHLETAEQLVYLQGMPKHNVGPMGNFIPDELVKAFKAFVRITTNGAPLPAGARVCLQWDNSTGSRAHIPSDEYKDTWWGSVLPGMEKQCAATNTHFCVWFTMPAGGRAPRRIHDAADRKCADHELLAAWIQVKISAASALREIKGMKKLAYPTNDPALAAVRMALMSDPSRRSTNTWT